MHDRKKVWEERIKDNNIFYPYIYIYIPLIILPLCVLLGSHK